MINRSTVDQRRMTGSCIQSVQILSTGTGGHRRLTTASALSSSSDRRRRGLLPRSVRLIGASRSMHRFHRPSSYDRPTRTIIHNCTVGLHSRETQVMRYKACDSKPCAIHRHAIHSPRYGQGWITHCAICAMSGTPRPAS